MAIDLTTARIGDPVTIHGTFRGSDDGAALVTITGFTVNPYGGLADRTWIVALAPLEIATHRPGQLVRGDRVVSKVGSKTPGTIVHIHDGRAWIDWDGAAGAGGGSVCALDRLERI